MSQEYGRRKTDDGVSVISVFIRNYAKEADAAFVTAIKEMLTFQELIKELELNSVATDELAKSLVKCSHHEGSIVAALEIAVTSYREAHSRH
jgi:hypothetical protein